MLVTPAFLKPLLDVPVAVLGAGVSGLAVRALVERVGARGQIYDERGADGALRDFRPAGHKLVVFSPGFAPTHPWLAAARAAGAICLGEVDFASLYWRGRVIAITGTNGKTTTTEFLTHALAALGRDATATGNIGFPFCQLVADRGGGAPDSYAVCEVSSFQGETFRHFRADSALWTNFAEDHLERHGTMQEYFLAKWRLFERTVGGNVFAGTSVQLHASQFGQTLPLEACVATEGQSGDVLLRATAFAEYPQRENFLLVAAWWRAAGLREDDLYAAARSFQVGAHRLQLVAERGGVRWWDDSKATNFHAAEAALGGFQSPVLLVLGGKSKGGDVQAFIRRIAPRAKHAALIGETRHVLATFCGAAGVIYTLCGTVEEAVAALARHALPGDDVLLSPGFSSLDQYRGYAERGARFAAAALALPSASKI
jgi:UDP-N-acetylmuramoylalanine--D-glutamate ligase